ncbi:MAG: membrane protein insertion efficiency factor YidD [Spirochaetaceae bacterium]|nr:membrane protein insertion efficiency factor YidD [Spirochaetaceae bacterium]
MLKKNELKALSALKKIPAFCASLLIRFYQTAISPHKPSVCRFYPSCSEYAYQAIKIHGFIGGFRLAAGRFLRCHPFNDGGYDPVPLPKRKNQGF